MSQKKSTTMKNYFILSCCVVGMCLFGIQATLPYQHNNTLLKKGIFDIKNEVKSKSKIEFETKKSGGISTYQTKRLSPSTLKVTYTFERKETPNPLSVNYDFEIKELENNEYKMDMIGIIPFMSMNIAPNIETVYTGSNLIYPNIPKVNQTLSNAEGKLMLKMKSKSKHLLSYHLEVKNRKITKKEKILLNGEEYEAFVHTYKFYQKTILSNSELIANIEETVTEWLVPNHGLVRRERNGKLTTPPNNSDGEIQTFNTQLTSNLLTIEKW